MRVNKKTLILASIPVVIGGWALFRPELLFVNQSVNEKLPTTTAQKISVLESGSFNSYAHETTGKAEVVESNGKRFLRLTNFKTSNGPDVRVLLVKGTDSKDISNDRIELGSLKGNIGDQNYEIPATVDLKTYQAVSIWCQRFSVGFGGATLKSDASAIEKSSASLQSSGPAYLLARFGGPIEVTFGKPQGNPGFAGRAAIIEENGTRYLSIKFSKLPAGKYDLRLVKQESLSTGAFPSGKPFLSLGTASTSAAKISISKEIDAWLYRSIAIIDTKSKKVVSFINLRSKQELAKKVSFI